MKDKLFTIVIYLSGMLSFFLVDFIIARYETTEAIANWASIKSVIMIGGTLVLFGMDQVMVRLPHQALSVLKRSYLQIFIAVLIYGGVIYSMGLLSEGLWLLIAVFLLAMSTLFFGFYRSRFLLLPAQIVTNGWKPLFLLVLILFFTFEIPRNYSIIFIITLSISLLVAHLLNKEKNRLTNIEIHELETVQGQYSLGARFFISLMSPPCLMISRNLLNSWSNSSLTPMPT